jgi:hypothetical protein
MDQHTQPEKIVASRDAISPHLQIMQRRLTTGDEMLIPANDRKRVNETGKSPSRNRSGIAFCPIVGDKGNIKIEINRVAKAKYERVIAICNAIVVSPER